MKTDKKPSPEALAAFHKTFSMITEEQGLSWMLNWDAANALTPSEIMELEEMMDYKRKVIRAYDSLINSQPQELKLRLIKEFPTHFNAKP